MLQRKAYSRLLDWKQNKKKQGMLVTGARQVGKTYLIRVFASEQYENFVEINLIENRRAAGIIDGAENVADLLTRLSVLAEKPMIPGKTLIFIDEAQVSKEILTWIKFLVDRGEYDFILSGSLLGVEMKNVRSVPVGYLDILTIYPMDFEEFCWANGMAEDILSIVRSSFVSRSPVPDFIHQRCIRLFHEYLIVGGMPDVVLTFTETRNLQRVRQLQQNIVELYKRDIAQYNPERGMQIKKIYDLIPSQISKPNKRFIYRDLQENARFGRFEDDFVWLEEAGVALPVHIAEEPVYPLKISKATNLFKLFLSDVGLLTGSLMREAVLDMLEKTSSINYGAIYENIVAQELKAHGYDLYYYNSRKRGEVDFILETGYGNITLLEVKSGKDYKRHVALTNLLSVPGYRFSGVFVLCEENLHEAAPVTYLPCYMVFCL